MRYSALILIAALVVGSMPRQVAAQRAQSRFTPQFTIGGGPAWRVRRPAETGESSAGLGITGGVAFAIAPKTSLGLEMDYWSAVDFVDRTDDHSRTLLVALSREVTPGLLVKGMAGRAFDWGDDRSVIGHATVVGAEGMLGRRLDDGAKFGIRLRTLWYLGQKDTRSVPPASTDPRDPFAVPQSPTEVRRYSMSGLISLGVVLRIP